MADPDLNKPEDQDSQSEEKPEDQAESSPPESDQAKPSGDQTGDEADTEESDKPPEISKKILVVMGVQLLKRQLRKLLEPAFEFLEAEQEKTALSLLQTHKPDIVFLDNNLRDTDGIDIVRKMRQLGFTTPIIMSFNTISEKDVNDIADQKVAAYFTHPIDYAEVVETINEVLAAARIGQTRKGPGGVSIRVPKDTLVCQKGDPGKECYVIQSGRVRVFRSLKGGQEHTLAELGPGDIFGEMSLVNPRPRNASVITIDETELFVLTKDNLLIMIQKKPEFAFKLIQVLALRLEKADMMIERYILSLKQ